MRHVRLLALFLCVVGAAPGALPQARAAGQLTIEQLIDIRHPSSPMWSPDGRSVVFVWDRAGVSKVYVSAVAPGTAPKELGEAGSSLTGAFWSVDGPALLVPKDGDLWRVPLDGRAASAVWTTLQPETNIVASPDGARVAFVRESEIVVRSLTDAHESFVARGDNVIGGLGWSPDGQHLVYTAGASTVRHEQTPAYSGSKIVYTINENVPGHTFVVPVSGGSPRALSVSGGLGPRRWLDAKRFLFDRTSPDFKRRSTLLVDIAGGEPEVLHEIVEEKFWSMPGDAGGNAQPSPDGRWIAFLSDRDGWDHLYVMPAAGGAPIQITKGTFEAWRPQWSPDS